MRWPKYWSFSVSIIPSKEMPGLISFRMLMLKILQARLQRYVNHELPDIPTGFRKGREPEIKLPTSAGSWEKQESCRKISISALLTFLLLASLLPFSPHPALTSCSFQPSGRQEAGRRAQGSRRGRSSSEVTRSAQGHRDGAKNPTDSH